MTFQTYLDLGHNIIRIDTGMIKEEMAACYLVEDNQEFALIETGTHHTVPIVMKLLAQRDIQPDQVKYVIPTHVHLDHAGGVGSFMQELTKATLLIHPKGARHMISPGKLKAGTIAVYGEETFSRIYGDVIPVDESRVQIQEDASEVMLGNRKLVFYDTPGHANHHFCVYDPQSNGIFTGDTFGLAFPALTTEKGPFILPTTTPVQFDPEALKQSIQRLLDLKPDTMYLTHYGPVSNPSQLAESLFEQIDYYAKLGAEMEAAVAPHELENQLISALTDYTLARIREHGCQQDDETLRAQISMDMRLNAQGIIVWLGRNKA